MTIEGGEIVWTVFEDPVKSEVEALYICIHLSQLGRKWRVTVSTTSRSILMSARGR